MRGKTCSVSFFSGLRLFSQPYMNMLCLRECACISQYMATPHSSISLPNRDGYHQQGHSDTRQILPSNHGFGIPNGWICLADNRTILAVQVLAGQRVTGVAHDDSVRVQHRHQLEYELVAQSLGHRCVTGDEVHQALHHPRRRCLAGMNSRRHHNRFLSLHKPEAITTKGIQCVKDIGYTRIFSSLLEGAVTVR